MTTPTRTILAGSDRVYTAIFTNSGVDSVTLTASADTYVSAGYPDYNYEGYSLVVAGPSYAGWEIRSLCRFNCTSVPAGSTVSAVELRLDQYYPNNTTAAFVLSAHEALNGWNPATVTWNLQPTWGSQVASKAWAGNSWVLSSSESPALKTLVQKWVNNPSVNFGLTLRCPSGSNYVYFGSRELTDYDPPQLVVYYTPPADTQGDTITNLLAKTSSSGSTINPNSWQRDNSPYFYWDVPSSAMPIVGYSFALDAQPDQTIDVTVPYFQYPSGSLANGQHTFRVKSVDANGNWSPTPASFNIWMDREPPANGTISINNGAPSTGVLIVTLNNLGATDGARAFPTIM